MRGEVRKPTETGLLTPVCVQTAADVVQTWRTKQLFKQGSLITFIVHTFVRSGLKSSSERRETSRFRTVNFRPLDKAKSSSGGRTEGI